MEKHKYTEQELQFLRDNVEGTTLQEQTDLFNQKFGTNLHKKKIAAIKSKHKIKPKTPPPSTARPGFTKGHTYGCKYKVGDIRFLNSFRAIFQIKVAMPNVWRPYHHVLYEQYHNVKLPPDAKVLFVDGNRTNFDIDNLKLVT